MIAEVYPLLRLPRKKHVFDYATNEGQPVTRGSLVQIPYRQKMIWGIVRAVKDKPPRGITLKQIAHVYPVGGLREEELSFFEHLAQDLAQSTASVLYASLPTPPRRPGPRASAPLSWLPLTLPRGEAEHVLRIVHTLSVRGKAFVQTPDLRRAAAVILGYLQKHAGQKILILVPTVRDMNLIRRHLTGFQPLIITGAESNNERFAAWQTFRESEDGILLGTRTALLSIDAHITTIFLLRAGDENHKQLDRNPRFDAREVVWQHHEAFASNVFCLDVAPSPALLARLEETECLSWGVYPNTRVVNMNQERLASVFATTSYTAATAIEETLARGLQVLGIYNRKGASAERRCRDCGHRFLCSHCSTPLTSFSHTLECARCRKKEPLALRCSTCGSGQLVSLRTGNLDVAKQWQEQFPNASVAIIDKDHPDPQNADLLLVTTFFYETVFDPFKKSHIGLVVHLDVDAPLYHTSSTAVEDFMRDSWQWAWVGFGRRAPVILQTASPDLLAQVLSRPFAVATEELEARARYQLPPWYRWSRILYKEPEKRRAEIAMQQLSEELRRVPNVVIHPMSWSPKGYAVLECGVPTEQFSQLLPIFTQLPDRYIIDTSRVS